MNNSWVPTKSFNSKFNDIFDLVNLFDSGYSNPNISRVNDKEDKFIIELALPGFEKSDFEINVDDNLLSVIINNKNTFISNFHKEWKIPDIVDKDNISASYTNGILLINIPKNEKHKPRKIEVK